MWALLVGMQSGAAAMDNGILVPQKLKYNPAIPHLWDTQKN